MEKVCVWKKQVPHTNPMDAPLLSRHGEDFCSLFFNMLSPLLDDFPPLPLPLCVHPEVIADVFPTWGCANRNLFQQQTAISL